MKGQEEKHHYEEHDYEFCGTTTPPVVKTEGPRLVLLFKVRNGCVVLGQNCSTSYRHFLNTI